MVVIHGIGEQRPMDTVRGFVDAVLPEVERGPKWFSKPDGLTETFELRILQNRAQPRTRFFEYYWAHRPTGTKYAHVLSWARALLWRRPGRVPRHLRGLWWASWASVVVAAAAWIWWATAGGDPAWWTGLLTTVLGMGLQGVVLNYAGDAARYLSPSPANIALRHAIRKEGVALLDALHAERHPTDPSRPLYDRIVVVGHSLGSVIAYDILNAAFHRYARTYERSAEHDQPALKALDEAATDADTWQAAQAAAYAELQELGHPWRVTDLITVGSPLAHAAVLLASDAEELQERIAQRELPRCPPVTDDPTGETTTYSFRVWEPYEDSDGNQHRLRAPHDAAVFAITRWTNLYTPTGGLLRGDFISGPLAPWFGPGIRDVAVRHPSWWVGHSPLAHTAYWSTPRDQVPTKALVDALDLDAAPVVPEEDP